MNIEKFKKIKKILAIYPQKPKLLAVTKYSDIKTINNAIENGVDIIGENRLENALEKFKYLSKNVEKHFIGALQTKKLRKIYELFDIIESIGTIKQLQKINEIAKNKDKKANIYLQFNISNEEQKSGFNPSELAEIIQVNKNLKNINIIGIMGIASLGEENEIRNQFKLAKKIFEELKTEIKTIKELSIGMSNDYEIALQEGATIVRIGSILFK